MVLFFMGAASKCFSLHANGHNLDRIKKSEVDEGKTKQNNFTYTKTALFFIIHTQAGGEMNQNP